MTSLPLRVFVDPQLAKTALTHKSAGAPNNERLEWLGDALLDFETSALVYDRFGLVAEGGLTLIRARLVRGEALAALARRIGLPRHLRLGEADIADGRENEKILAGAMEAYLAAIHLDGGDVRAILADLLDADLAAIADDVRRDGLAALRDAKTRLQEWLQRRGMPLPVYTLLRTNDKPPHRRLFCVECRAAPECAERGQGKTRLTAEQEAAALCLKRLG